jgi:hypothetical protein
VGEEGPGPEEGFLAGRLFLGGERDCQFQRKSASREISGVRRWEKLRSPTLLRWLMEEEVVDEEVLERGLGKLHQI